MDVESSQPARTFSICGAGPAGLAAALTIQKSGARAVVFERRGEVGGRFHGDFQGIENWTTERDVLEELAEIGIEPSFDHAPFGKASSSAPAAGCTRFVLESLSST